MGKACEAIDHGPDEWVAAWRWPLLMATATRTRTAN
jgi:hypothetical protein